MISFKELKQRLFHPYYIIHFIYGSCYVVIRLIQLWKTQSINLQETEAKAFLLLTFLIIWKCIISISAEELSSVIILYTKFFTLCSLFWRIGFWTSFFYIVGWIVLSTLFPQPWYRGPSEVADLTESSFRENVLLKKSNTSKITEINPDDDTKYWIVMLYANWSVACLNFEAVFAKLSLEYKDVPHLKFAKVDIDVYSDLAEEFGVSKDPASFDLPTLILFHQGKEIRRLPELTVTKEGETASRTDAAKNTITRLGWSKKPATIVQSFYLEEIKHEKKHQ